MTEYGAQAIIIDGRYNQAIIEDESYRTLAQKLSQVGITEVHYERTRHLGLEQLSCCEIANWRPHIIIDAWGEVMVEPA